MTIRIFNQYIKQWGWVLLIAFLLSGCASLFGDDEDETLTWSASKFYSEAKSSLEGGNYSRAIELFEKLEARYPFGQYAEQSQLEIAYAYYKYDEPEAALAAVDRFLKIHPRHKNADYAYYLRGLVNFNRGLGLIARFIPQDTSQRDPGTAKESFRDFAVLVNQYPNSKYAPDARQRMVYLRNTLAQYEINVADFYMRRGAYVAAINRAKYVIERYQKTPAVPKALVILVDAYQRLELTQLATDTQRVLEKNYPNGIPDEADDTWWDMVGLDK